MYAVYTSDEQLVCETHRFVEAKLRADECKFNTGKNAIVVKSETIYTTQTLEEAMKAAEKERSK